MITDTKTKLITSFYKDAPQIQNSYGSLSTVLTKCLTEGFNEQSVNGFEEEGDQIVVKLSRNHGYVQNSVIAISDASLTELNGEFRVLSSSHDSIYIKRPEDLSLDSSTLEDSCKIKIAPLGYEIVYENEAKTTICFRSKSKNTPGILKIIDEIPPNGYSTGWAKYARVVAGQEVDSSGAFLSDIKVPYSKQYPNVEHTGNGVTGSSGIHGFAKWHYAFGTDGYNRENYGPYNHFPKNWKIIGDGDTFYLILDPSQPDRFLMYGFGAYISENKEETTNICLQAHDRYVAAAATDTEHMYERSDFRFGSSTRNQGSFLLSTIYEQFQTNCRYTSFGLYVGDSYYDRPWHSDSIRSMNPSSGQVVAGLVYILDNNKYVRGFHRGFRYIYGNSSELSTGSTSNTGEIIIDIIDPERDRNMSYVFSLKDWEEV